jgi:hypothetical protein
MVAFFKMYLIGWDWVHLARLSLIGLLYQPRMIDDDESGGVGGRELVG